MLEVGACGNQQIDGRGIPVTVAGSARVEGLDAQLSAAEIVRRAERGIGLAIRKGQETGEIATRSNGKGWANQHGRAQIQRENLTSPKAYFSGGQDAIEIYQMTDGVSPAQFEAGNARRRQRGPGLG